VAELSVRQYELLRPIGRGGMATVYLARQRDLDRYVALKELAVFEDLDRVAARRFLREARLAGSLNHPNIVTVYDYFEDGGTPYIAMEYVPGGSLRPHVGDMSLAQTAGVIEGVLSGLEHAEHHRVVHRDLKPENVLVTPEGRIKIADFGIAKATWTLQPGGDITATGMTLGSPNYMAPEQAMAKKLGPPTDLYSLGVMAFEMLVGYAPFGDSETPVAIVMRHINDSIPPVSSLVPGVDPVVSDWVAWMTQKDPADRPQSAGEAWEALEDAVTRVEGPNWRRAAALPLLVPEEMALDDLDTERDGDRGYRTPATNALGAGAAAAGVGAAAGLGATMAPTRPMADDLPGAQARRFSTGAKLGLLLLALLAAAAIATAGGGGGGGGGGQATPGGSTAITPAGSTTGTPAGSTTGAPAGSGTTAPGTGTTAPGSTVPAPGATAPGATTAPGSPAYGVGDSKSDDPSDDAPQIGEP
jgi:tRNA A-37 threonylcarbamoyl transferase component Bud32